MTLRADSCRLVPCSTSGFRLFLNLFTVTVFILPTYIFTGKPYVYTSAALIIPGKRTPVLLAPLLKGIMCN